MLGEEAVHCLMRQLRSHFGQSVALEVEFLESEERLDLLRLGSKGKKRRLDTLACRRTCQGNEEGESCYEDESRRRAYPRIPALE